MEAMGAIGGRRYDFLFFFATVVPCALIGLFALAQPVIAWPLWWLWLALIDGPHLVATWSRTYFDANERARRRTLLIASLVLITPGFIALLLSRELGTRAPFDVFLGLTAIVGWHHNVRQSYGIMSIFRADQRHRRLDSLFAHAIPWVLYALLACTHPFYRRLLGLPADLSAPERSGAIAAGAIIAIAIAGYAATILARASKKSAVFILLAAAVVPSFAMFIVGWSEPLLPTGSADPDRNFVAMTIVIGLSHGSQYLGIVFAANRRRHGTKLFGSPLKSYAIFVAISFGYVLINAGRMSEGANVDLFLSLYWGLFLHHYYLDQKIWHPRSDPALRAELGVQR